MQREIKFRGKTKNGIWLYGDLIHRVEIYVIPEDGLDSMDCYEIIPETDGQYTGLKDKNGKEIYEGDIIRFNNNEDDLCQVCFGEFPVYDIETEEVTDTAHGWYAKVVFTDGLSRLEPFCYDRILNNQWIGTLEIEVIGNIHDNPELLEVSDTERS